MNEDSNINLRSLFFKIVLSLILFNFICVITAFLPIGKLSLYNILFPGRQRLPFGENPPTSFNLTLDNVDAMIASHEIAGSVDKKGVFRIILAGDSSIWGFLHKPGETLAGNLKEYDFECGGQSVEIHNLGYPSLSVLKDLLFIDRAVDYEPDMIMWFITLESLNRHEQTSTPLVTNNPEVLNSLIHEYGLGFQKAEIDFWDRTLFRQRRNYADLLRLQLYGLMWAATGIDQEYPDSYTPAQRDFEKDASYKNYENRQIDPDDLALEIFSQTIDKISQAEIFLINEPILISKGTNSQIRYNYYYPRWAYDQYRQIINEFAQENQIKYLDFWDLVPEQHFTNSAIHLDTDGQKILAEQIAGIIEEYCEK